MRITAETTVRAPLDTVWRAWTSPDDIVRYDDERTYTEVVPQRQGWQAILANFAPCAQTRWVASWAATRARNASTRTSRGHENIVRRKGRLERLV